VEVCDEPIPRPEESYRVCMSLSVIRPNNNPLPRNEYVEVKERMVERKKKKKTDRQKWKIQDILSSFQSKVIFHYIMFLIHLKFLYEVINIFKFILKKSLKLCARVNKW
jgi:hypothetical protein